MSYEYLSLYTQYADFESILLAQRTQSGCASSDGKLRTEKRQLHNSCGAALYIKLNDIQFFSRKPLVLRGGIIAVKCLDHVMVVANEIRHFLRKKISMNTLTVQQQCDFQSATKCHICSKIFHSHEKRVKNHNYLTPKYRRLAHNSCNLLFRIHPKNIKILYINHNLLSYGTKYSRVDQVKFVEDNL